MAQPRRKKAAPPIKASVPIDREAISTLAFELWVGRGRPEGSPEQDWFEAERILRATAESTLTSDAEATSTASPLRGSKSMAAG
jgi:hypothetical protein